MPHNATGDTYTTGRGNLENGVAKHNGRSGGDGDEPEERGDHDHGRCIGEQYRQSADRFVCCDR
jgi:hypothetical protein